MIGSTIINIPFSLYKTFVIEERFGFNKMSKKTFFLDKLKGLLMSLNAKSVSKKEKRNLNL